MVYGNKLIKNAVLGGMLVVAGAFGVTLISGFQGPNEKSGVVDFNKVMQQSAFGKQSTTNLNNALSSRRNLLQFVSTNKVMTTEQAQRLQALSLKDSLTAAEQAELAKIKSDAQEADKKRTALSQKTDLTDAERQLLQDYAQRVQTMNQVLDRWNVQFQDDLQQLQDQARQQTLDRAKAAVQEVAKAQGYSIVFEATVAPYGVNDLTDAAIKAMDAKK